MHTANDFTPTPPPARQPRAVFHPATATIPATHSAYGHAAEVTVGDLTAEVRVHMGHRREPALVVVSVAWTDDAAPVLNSAEWAVYSAARPGLAEDLYEAAVDKWTGYDDQRRELRDGGL